MGTKRIEDQKVLRWVVEERDQVCLYGLFGKNPTPCKFGLDPHHLEKRSHLGDDVPENLITLCRRHHDDAEAHKIIVDELKAILTFVYGYKYGDNSHVTQTRKCFGGS